MESRKKVQMNLMAKQKQSHRHRKKTWLLRWQSESEICSVMSNSAMPWNSPSQNTGVGSISLLQGIFPTQGSNPGLPHCRWILYQLSHR